MKKINYQFKNQALCDLALTQSGADAAHNNERLEFVGDRVLGLTVAGMLYDMFPDEAEGDLARRHAVLVSTDTLAQIARELGLDTQLRHGHMTGGRINHILADAMEAMLGAIYLDGGFVAAQEIIIDLWRQRAAADINPPKDSKTALQEFVQKRAQGELPVYKYVSQTGASHNPEFVVHVSALGQTAAGRGASKKAASMAAADELLKILAISKRL